MLGLNYALFFNPFTILQFSSISTTGKMPALVTINIYARILQKVKKEL
jgi:hypothetical protein